MLKSFVSSLIVERFLKENSWDNSLHCFHDGEKIKSHLLLPPWRFCSNGNMVRSCLCDDIP